MSTVATRYQQLKSENQALNRRERDSELCVIQSRPLVAKIEVTNRCNLQCRMCRPHERTAQYSDLSLSVLHKLESIAPTLLSVYLYGVGEPLLYPFLAEAIHLFRSYEVNVGIITNGTLLTEALIDSWVTQQLYKVSISMDGATKESYERIRSGASYEHIVHMLEHFRDRKACAGTLFPRVTLNYIAMQSTIHELPALVDLAAMYNVSEVIVNDLIVFFDDMQSERIHYNDPLYQAQVRIAQEKARAYGILLALPAPFQFQKTMACEQTAHLQSLGDCPTAINRCTEPWSGFWLTGEGVVTPCCYWFKPMGDLHRHDFLTVWNNTEYQSLRKSVNTSQRNPHCCVCPIAGMTQRVR